jgi:hypothetical protein
MGPDRVQDSRKPLISPQCLRLSSNRANSFPTIQFRGVDHNPDGALDSRPHTPSARFRATDWK